SIVNNLVGTPDGSSAPGVTQTTGISWGGAPAASPITNNVISGNTTGLSISSDNGANISSNRIGTNATGTAALPNTLGFSGGSLSGTNITGNLISGNSG